ncbi:NUDIX domain-containing protein [Candidatus Nomurabacteria bacterium]|nr:NUDIX domain-containing protein [Candidatus Kaiserbacteria bacterium]MCB9811125.1 NUDIX domain-containing protein [Candidatus Nomurabacteria bacterium]MCB9814439.1 NUDIX domain-containing protein [Candidatus Nomurabacteria bacterium]
MLEKVFLGDFIKVTKENGIERVFLRDSVHTFLVTDEKKIRLTVEKILGDNKVGEKIQSGIIEQGEASLQAAKRELLEELGLEAADWQELVIHKSTGTVNDICYYFVARQLSVVSEDLDGEILGTKDYSLEELYEKSMNSEFSPVTQAAVAKLYFEVTRGKIEL